MIFSVETSVSATHHPAVRHWELYEQTDKPVIIIGKTMLMHERVHRRAADLPEEFRKAVQKGGVCESCDDLVMNAVATAASGVGPVQLRHNVWPHVRMRLPAPGGVSSIRRTGTVLKGVGRLACVGCFNALATTVCSDREACESNCSASINVVVLKKTGVCCLIRIR